MQDRQGNVLRIESQPVGAWVPDGVEPGTLLLLEQGESAGANPFRAVLACPRCGALALITAAQYDGLRPMLCDSLRCSAEYKLVNDQVHFRRAQ